MYLESLQTTLRQELCATHTQRHFEAIQPLPDALQGFATVRALLDHLDDCAPDTRPQRHRLLGTLVAAVQADPTEPLWNAILLYAFLPGLWPIRARTRPHDHAVEDLDGELWAAFLDVVASYPLHRTGSIPAGILFDTRKDYHRRLQRQQREAALQAELAGMASAPGAAAHGVPDLVPARSPASSAQDRAEMLAALVRCDTISAADARLLWCTDVCGMTIPQFLEAQEIKKKTDRLSRRTCARLWRRRLRARQRLEIFFKKMPASVSSFGPHPACYIVRGKHANDTTMTDPDATLVAVVLRDLAQRLTRMLLVSRPDHQLVLAVALILEEIAEAYLGELDEGELAGEEESAPHPAMARLLARLDRYIAEPSARWQQAS